MQLFYNPNILEDSIEISFSYIFDEFSHDKSVFDHDFVLALIIFPESEPSIVTVRSRQPRKSNSSIVSTSQYRNIVLLKVSSLEQLLNEVLN